MPNMELIASQIDKLGLDTEKTKAVDALVEEITGQKINRTPLVHFGVYSYEGMIRILHKDEFGFWTLYTLGGDYACHSYAKRQTEQGILDYMKCGYVFTGKTISAFIK